MVFPLAYTGARRPPLQGRGEDGAATSCAGGFLIKDPSALRRRRPSPRPQATAAEEDSATVGERGGISGQGRLSAARSSRSGDWWSRARRTPRDNRRGRASRAPPVPGVRRGPRALALTGPAVSHEDMAFETCSKRGPSSHKGTTLGGRAKAA